MNLPRAWTERQQGVGVGILIRQYHKNWPDRCSIGKGLAAQFSQQEEKKGNDVSALKKYKDLKVFQWRQKK